MLKDVELLDYFDQLSGIKSYYNLNSSNDDTDEALNFEYKSENDFSEFGFEFDEDIQKDDEFGGTTLIRTSVSPLQEKST